jgi:hypothetical protein
MSDLLLFQVFVELISPVSPSTRWTSLLTVHQTRLMVFTVASEFLDFLEVSHATMCLTVQCPACWCPRDQLDDTNQVFPLRDTQEVYEDTASERKRLLHPDGQPRQGCKQQVSRIGIFMVYIMHKLTILQH